jgi:hypothetical protein
MERFEKKKKDKEEIMKERQTRKIKKTQERRKISR